MLDSKGNLEQRDLKEANKKSCVFEEHVREVAGHVHVRGL